MKRSLLAALLLLAGCGSVAFAQDQQTERFITVDQIASNTGNNWRLIIATPAATSAVLVSSSAENAVRRVPGTASLEISVFGSRFVVNTCTAAAMALSPTQIGLTFNPGVGVVLSSAGAPSSNPVGTMGVNYIKVDWQGPIWAIWDTNATACTGSGGGGYETYNHPGTFR